MSDGFSCPLSPDDAPEQAWIEEQGFFVCSCCGSLRPDEAMALARSGWKVGRYNDEGEYRISTQMQTDHNYGPKIIHVSHYDDRQFCEILKESLGGEWTREGDQFVRPSA